MKHPVSYVADNVQYENKEKKTKQNKTNKKKPQSGVG